MADQVYTINPAGGADHSSLQDAISSRAGDIVTAGDNHYLRYTATTSADTTAATLTGYTTDSDNRVYIEATGSAANTGTTYSTSKARLEVTSGNCLNVTGCDNVTIRDLQFKLTNNSSSDYACVQVNDASADDVILDSLFLVGAGSGGGNGWGVNVTNTAGTTTACYIYNCVAYDFTTGVGVGFRFNDTGAILECYNCSSIDNDRGFDRVNGTFIAQNCLGDSTTSYNGTFGGHSSFNAADDATAPGLFGRDSQTFTYTASGSDDFSLADGDVGARGYGTKAPLGKSLFSDDKTGTTRPAAASDFNWDIGAFQSDDPTKVFYAVSNDTTSSWETGSGNVTVSGSTMTFTVDQTHANMGIGCVVDYDSPSKYAYISGKTSASVWTATSVTGGTPSAATGVAVNSIKHVFTSLINAEDDSDDAGYLNFSDLATNNIALYWPLYYVSAADGGNVYFSGYTCNGNCKLNIIAPSDTTSQCNQSHKHSGVWSSTKATVSGDIYQLFNCAEEIMFDGIQIENTRSTAAVSRCIAVSTGVCAVVKNCICKFSGNAGGNARGIEASNSAANLIAFNNICYDFNTTAGGYGIYSAGNSALFYYNSVHNVNYGYLKGGSTDAIAKCCLVQSVDTDGYNGTFLTGTDQSTHNNSEISEADAPGGNSTSGAVTFEDEASDDFHLGSADTKALEKGTPLGADAYWPVTEDTEGNTRDLSTPDMGACELQTLTDTDLLDGKVIVSSEATPLFDGKLVVLSKDTDLLDGKVIVATVDTDLLDGKVVVLNDDTDLLDGKVVVLSDDTDLLDGKVVILSDDTDLLDGKVVVLSDDTDLLDGKVVIEADNLDTDLLDGKVVILNDDTDLLDGKVVIANLATPLFDGKIVILDDAVSLLDGKVAVLNDDTDLLDGKVVVLNLDTDLLDGKVIVKDSATALMDGKVAVLDDTVALLDGKVAVLDKDTDLLDGKVAVVLSDTDLFDGKIVILDDATALLDGKIQVTGGADPPPSGTRYELNTSDGGTRYELNVSDGGTRAVGGGH